MSIPQTNSESCVCYFWRRKLLCSKSFYYCLKHFTSGPVKFDQPVQYQKTDTLKSPLNPVLCLAYIIILSINQCFSFHKKSVSFSPHTGGHSMTSTMTITIFIIVFNWNHLCHLNFCRCWPDILICINLTYYITYMCIIHVYIY